LDGVIGTWVVDGALAGSVRVLAELIVRQRAQAGAPNFVDRQLEYTRCLESIPGRRDVSFTEVAAEETFGESVMLSEAKTGLRERVKIDEMGIREDQ